MRTTGQDPPHSSPLEGTQQSASRFELYFEFRGRPRYALLALVAVALALLLLLVVPKVVASAAVTHGSASHAEYDTAGSLSPALAYGLTGPPGTLLLLLLLLAPACSEGVTLCGQKNIV